MAWSLTHTCSSHTHPVEHDGKFVENVGNKPLHHELPLDPDPSSWSILALALAFFEDFVQSLLCIFDEL